MMNTDRYSEMPYAKDKLRPSGQPRHLPRLAIATVIAITSLLLGQPSWGAETPRVHDIVASEEQRAGIMAGLEAAVGKVDESIAEKRHTLSLAQQCSLLDLRLRIFASSLDPGDPLPLPEEQYEAVAGVSRVFSVVYGALKTHPGTFEVPPSLISAAFAAQRSLRPLIGDGPLPRGGYGRMVRHVATGLEFGLVGLQGRFSADPDSAPGLDGTSLWAQLTRAADDPGAAIEMLAYLVRHEPEQVGVWLGSWHTTSKTHGVRDALAAHAFEKIDHNEVADPGIVLRSASRAYPRELEDMLHIARSTLVAQVAAGAASQGHMDGARHALRNRPAAVHLIGLLGVGSDIRTLDAVKRVTCEANTEGLIVGAKLMIQARGGR